MQRQRNAGETAGNATHPRIPLRSIRATCCVERNPVRARMVRKAENYRWSSASAHCGARPDAVLTPKPFWRKQFEAIGDWSAWLAQGDEPSMLDVLRRNADKGLPCGSEKFIQKLEKLTGQALQYRPRGRPRTRKEEEKG